MSRPQTSFLFSALTVLLTFTACAEPPADGDTPSGGKGGTSSEPGGGGSGGTSNNNNNGGATAGGGGTTTSQGGTGGSSAPAPGGDCAAIAPTALIADFETGTAKLAEAEGRTGSWFIFDDGTGTVTPVKVANMPLPAEGPGACNSMFAFHLVGKGLKGFGAGVGSDLGGKTAAGMSAPYDLSAYKAIALRAKAAKPTFLRVSIADSGTSPEGGKCADTTERTNKSRCGDYFGSDVTVTSQWKTFVLPFAQMAQRGFGLPIAGGFDPKTAYTFRAQSRGDAAAPVDLDIWLDDIHFVK